MSAGGRGGYTSHGSGVLAGSPALDPIVELLLSDCTVDELVPLLRSETRDILRATIVCLGRKGNLAHNQLLAELLHHDDTEIAALAEDSLWMIWMRAGSDWGNTLLGSANDQIRDSEFERAVETLETISAIEPEFAEAHHQRGIALSLLDRPQEAAEAFRQTLRLNRYHFSAALNLGHACAEQSDLRGALRHYRYALRLNPRLEELPVIVKQLKSALQRRSHA